MPESNCRMKPHFEKLDQLLLLHTEIWCSRLLRDFRPSREVYGSQSRARNCFRSVDAPTEHNNSFSSQ
jgi:hypothetical protein